MERSGYCYRNSSRSHEVSHTHSTLMTGLEMPRLQLEPAFEIKLKETTSPEWMGFKAISKEFSLPAWCLQIQKNIGLIVLDNEMHPIINCFSEWEPPVRPGVFHHPLRQSNLLKKIYHTSINMVSGYHIMLTTMCVEILCTLWFYNLYEICKLPTCNLQATHSNTQNR